MQPGVCCIAMINGPLLFGFLAFSIAVYAQDRGAISGIVTLSSSGEGIPDLVVTVRQHAGIGRPWVAVFGKPIQTTTDRTGHFLFKDLPAGSYQLTLDRAGSPGFVDSRRFIEVRADADAPPLAFSVSFPKTGTITGVVHDNSGKPSARVTVLLLLFNVEGPRQLVLWQGTNARGVYRLNDVPPGKFRVLAWPEQILLGGNDHETIRQSVPMFYSRTTVEGDGSVISLLGGEEINGIDITLESSIRDK